MVARERRPKIVIIEWNDHRESLLDLLLLADPSEAMIRTYLNRGRLFVLSIDDEPVGALG